MNLIAVGDSVTVRHFGHSGELIQGPDCDGNIVLVTLPCNQIGSDVTFTRHASHNIVVRPGNRKKSRAAANGAKEYCDVNELGGTLKFRTFQPDSFDVPESWGYGTSCTEGAGAIRCISRACGRRIRNTTVAKLLHDAAGAADPLMFNNDRHPRLFASRLGREVERFPRPLPAMDVLAFNSNPGGSPVDTQDISPNYTPQKRELFKEFCIDQLRVGIRDGNLYRVASAVHCSADSNQTFLPNPNYRSLNIIRRNVGALAIALSHTGWAANMLFEPNDPDIKQKIGRARELLAQIGIDQTLHYSIGSMHPNGQEVDINLAYAGRTRHFPPTHMGLAGRKLTTLEAHYFKTAPLQVLADAWGKRFRTTERLYA